MKEQIIQLPDDFEVKEVKDGKIILVEKEKKLTYNDIIKKLFPKGGSHFYINSGGLIEDAKTDLLNYDIDSNATSERQLEKLLAINKLMTVAKYLNGDWQPNWDNREELKYHYIKSITNTVHITCTTMFVGFIVYFKSKELAEQAIDILGEEIVNLALCTDY